MLHCLEIQLGPIANRLVHHTINFHVASPDTFYWSNHGEVMVPELTQSSAFFLKESGGLTRVECSLESRDL